MSARVDFLVAGAQKSGTSALHHFLSLHPEIGLHAPPVREPHYFSTRHIQDQSENYTGYHDLYTPEALSRVTGDITPIYLYLGGCLQRAHTYNPGLRIIVILRDPANRAYSQWNMERARGIESRSFLRALIHEAWVRVRDGQHMHFSYFQRGLYARQIKQLFAIFPRAQCLVIKHEDFEADLPGTLARVHDFLDVDRQPTPEKKRVNARNYAPLPRWIRKGLIALYLADIRRLERMLGWDCADWRS